MSKTAVVAKLTIKDGSKDEFLEAFGEMLKAVDDEPGTEVYVLNWDTKDENVAWIYEIYTDADALAAHSGSEAMAALGGVLGGVLGGRPEISIVNATAGKGVSL